MPETTISFETDSLDARVEMRGVLASLRAHPRVHAVRRVDEAPQPNRQSWVVEHDDVSEWTGSVDERRLATQLRRLEYTPPVDRPPEPRGWVDSWRRALQRLTEPGVEPVDPPPVVDAQEYRESLIRRALEAPAQRSALAQAMAAPLRQRLDYSGIARRTFLVEELPQGALPTYDRDVADPGSFVRETFERVAQLGAISAPAVNHLGAQRVQVPLFEIASNPTINLADIRERRFNLIDRHPPTPPPPWVGVGVYVRNKKDAEDLWVITGVDAYNVTIERWRGVYRSATVTFSSLTERYEPCLAPALPPTRFERELEV